MFQGFHFKVLLKINGLGHSNLGNHTETWDFDQGCGFSLRASQSWIIQNTKKRFSFLRIETFHNKKLMAGPKARRLNIRFVFKSFNPNKRSGLPEGLFILIIVKEMRHANRNFVSIGSHSQNPEITRVGCGDVGKFSETVAGESLVKILHFFTRHVIHWKANLTENKFWGKFSNKNMCDEKPQAWLFSEKHGKIRPLDDER